MDHLAGIHNLKEKAYACQEDGLEVCKECAQKRAVRKPQENVLKSSQQEEKIMQALERKETIQKFHDAVNMSSQELERWLDTKESQSVGWKKESNESVGHQMGRIIIQLLKKKKNDYTDEDFEHMQKVIGYVHRHMAQRPVKEDIATSHWRYSLMNWGHDPLK